MSKSTISPQQSLTDFMEKKVARAKELARKCEKCGVLFLDEGFNINAHTCWFNPPYKRDEGCGVSWREVKEQNR